MNTTNLTQTNLISQETAAIIEAIIGVEITSVITQRPTTGLVISPYDDKYGVMKKLGKFRVRNFNFDYKTGVLQYSYRNRWQRTWTNVYAQGQPVGYKLPTTNIRAGFIWGNFVFAENK